MKILVFMFFVLFFPVSGWSTIINIGRNSVAIDTSVIDDARIDKGFPATNFGTSTAASLGENFGQKKWTLFLFRGIADSIPSGEQCDSAWLGIIVSSEEGTDLTGSIDPVGNRLLKPFTEPEVSWDSSQTDPSGVAWTEAGAGSEGNDISATIMSNRIKVNNGAWLTSIDTSDYTFTDTIWFEIAESYIDSVNDGTIATDFGFRIASDTTIATYFISFRTSERSVDAVKPVLRLFTSVADGAEEPPSRRRAIELSYNVDPDTMSAFGFAYRGAGRWTSSVGALDIEVVDLDDLLDTNGDYKVNISDITLLIAYIFQGQGTPESFEIIDR